MTSLIRAPIEQDFHLMSSGDAFHMLVAIALQPHRKVRIRHLAGTCSGPTIPPWRAQRQFLEMLFLREVGRQHHRVAAG